MSKMMSLLSPTPAAFLAGRGMILILGVCGVVFGALLLWAGFGRLWDARKSPTVGAVAGDVIWALIGIGGGLALIVYCCALLLSVIARR